MTSGVGLVLSCVIGWRPVPVNHPKGSDWGTPYNDECYLDLKVSPGSAPRDNSLTVKAATAKIARLALHHLIVEPCKIVDAGCQVR